MTTSPISALSPLDGRYANKLNALRPLMSEQGYMHRRVQVDKLGQVHRATVVFVCENEGCVEVRVLGRLTLGQLGQLQQ